MPAARRLGAPPRPRSATRTSAFKIIRARAAASPAGEERRPSHTSGLSAGFRSGSGAASVRWNPSGA
ncbi:hypothetical protein E8E01_16320 [Methylorubrum populi]|nr:hypothetical protein E8E01_16320 [Methylorubrum populi]